MSARKKAKPARTGRRVFSFGDGKADGDAKMKEILGGKGANLAEMTRIGLPVPAGFTISTAVCAQSPKRTRVSANALSVCIGTWPAISWKISGSGR